jgi:hypothetical protein
LFKGIWTSLERVPRFSTMQGNFSRQKDWTSLDSKQENNDEGRKWYNQWTNTPEAFHTLVDWLAKTCSTISNIP